MIERIHWIEQLKLNGNSLEEILALLQPTQKIEEIDVQDIRIQMRKLGHDVAKLMEQMDEQEKQKLMNE